MSNSIDTPIDSWDPETQDIYEILEEVIDSFDDICDFEPEWVADWDSEGDYWDE